MLLAFGGAAVAQKPAPGEALPPLVATETDLFRSLLKFHGVEPVSALPDGRDRGRTVVVVFGTADAADLRPATSVIAQQVFGAGGAVLLATDAQGQWSNHFPQTVTLLVGSPTVRTTTTNGNDCLNGQTEMPFLVPRDAPFNPHLAQMSLLKRVATNRPGFLTAVRSDTLTVPLAGFPKASTAGPTKLAAVASDPAAGPGQAVVYSDAGLFANQMMTAAGTDNFAYAFHLTKYLVAGPDGTAGRTKCLFIENGRVRTDFDRFPLTPQAPKPPRPPLPPFEEIEKKLVDMANTAIDNVQTRDVIGKKLEPQAPKIARGTAITLGVLALLAGLAFARGRRNSAVLVPPPRADADPGHALDDRRQEILKSNDVAEPLREYLRNAFAGWGLPAGAAALPPVTTGGPPADERDLLARLRKLWEVAYGESGAAVSFVRWKELEPMIAEVAESHEDGWWQFASAPAGGQA